MNVQALSASGSGLRALRLSAPLEDGDLGNPGVSFLMLSSLKTELVALA